MPICRVQDNQKYSRSTKQKAFTSHSDLAYEMGVKMMYSYLTAKQSTQGLQNCVGTKSDPASATKKDGS